MTMEESLQIDDFFGSMPDIRDPEFNTKLNSKQEFFELGAKAVEDFPKKGEMFNSQHYNRRYAMYYDRILLAWDTGTGKSCAIGQIAEMLHEEYQKHPDDPTKIKKAIIVVNNKTLENNFRNEISCKCTDGIYDTKEVREETDITKQFKMIKKNMKEWYEFMTPTALANAIRSRRSQNSLYEFMSNTLFVIDEVHTLPTLADKKKRYVPETAYKTVEELTAEVNGDLKLLSKKETIYETIFRGFHTGHRNKIVIATATRRINEPADTVYLINLLRPLHDLMPYADSETYLAQGVDWFEQWTRGYISYLRVMKSPVTKDFQKRQITQGGGELVDKVDIYQVPMSMEQYYNYILADVGIVETARAIEKANEANKEAMNQLIEATEEALKAEAEEEGELAELQINEQSGKLNFKMEPRNVLHFLYPNITTGQAKTSSQAYNIYVKYDGYYDISLKSDEELPPEMAAIESALPSLEETEALKKATTMDAYGPYLERLSLYSAKMAKAVEVCLSAYIDDDRLAELMQDPLVKEDIYPFVGKGIGYIYFPDFVKGSGLFIFTLILQRFGYSEYRPEPKHLVTSGTGGVCGTSDGTNEQGNELQHLNKGKRFVKITGDMPEASINIIRNVVNSSDNKFGQYVQLVVGSRKSGIGLSINNGSFMIQMESSWHYSKYFQALSRIFRITSHVDLIRITEQRLVRYNIIHPGEQLTIDDIKMRIPIYNLCSVYVPPPPEEIEAWLENFLGLPEYELLKKIMKTENVNTADTMLYRILARKEEPNAIVNRWEKQVAYDSPVNRDRNIQRGDDDFSRECDFMECDYKSFGYVREPRDWTTKLLWHSGKEIEEISGWVKEELLLRSSLRFEDIIDILGGKYDHDRLAIARLFFVAIQNIIANNESMKDRFGVTRYIRIDHQGLIYLDGDVFSVGNNYQASDNNFYNSSLLMSAANAPTAFKDSLSDLSMEKNMIFYNRAREYYMNFLTERERQMELAQSTASANHDNTRELELLNAVNEELLKIDDGARDLFLEWAIEEVMVNDDESLFSNYVISFYGRWRFFSIIEPTDLLGKRGIKNENIYLLLSPYRGMATGHGMVSNFLSLKNSTIRILKPSENIGWRNASEIETNYYLGFMGEKRNELYEWHKNHYSVFGIYMDANDPTQFSILAYEKPPRGQTEYQARTVTRYNPYDGTTYEEVKMHSMWKYNPNQFKKSPTGKSHRNVGKYELIDILVDMMIYPPNFERSPTHEILNNRIREVLSKNANYPTTMKYLYNDLSNASNVNTLDLYYWWWQYTEQYGHQDLWRFIDRRFQESGFFINEEKLHQYVTQAFTANDHFTYVAPKKGGAKSKGKGKGRGRGRPKKSTTPGSSGSPSVVGTYLDPNVVLSQSPPPSTTPDSETVQVSDPGLLSL